MLAQAARDTSRLEWQLPGRNGGCERFAHRLMIAIEIVTRLDLVTNSALRHNLASFGPWAKVRDRSVYDMSRTCRLTWLIATALLVSSWAAPLAAQTQASPVPVWQQRSPVTMQLPPPAIPTSNAPVIHQEPLFSQVTPPAQAITPESLTPSFSTSPAVIPAPNALAPPVSSGAEFVPPPGATPAYPGLPPLDNQRVFEEPPVVDNSTRFPRMSRFASSVWQDHRHYYSWRTVGMYSAAFGLGAVMANTSIDQHFQDWYQREIGNSGFIHSFKYAGEGVIILPTYLVSMGIGYMLEDRPVGGWIGQWGQRSFRAALVGAPPMLLAQFVTGGSRPGEEPWNSAWRPFNDVNSVSGHAFMGAIPFLTAAQMVERPWLKFSLYGLSTMTGWSRVNDNAHYLSQIMLGWTMAVAATFAVDETSREMGFTLTPMLANGNHGLIAEWQY